MIKWLRGLCKKEELHTNEVRKQTAERMQQLVESSRALEQSKHEEREGTRLANSLNRINRRNHFAERVEQALRGLST